MKHLKFLSILIISLTLVGCSKNKKLECEKITSSDIGDYKEKVILNFKDETINYYKTLFSLEAKESKYLEEIKDIYETDLSEYQESGLKSNYQIEGNNITITIEGSVKDIKEAAINNNKETIVKLDQTIDEFKNNLIEEGYTCK